MSGNVVTGALTLERAQESLGGCLADIVYTDPPWGKGALQYFQTLNKDQGEADWDGFLESFCSVLPHVISPTAHIFVEMGHRWADQLSGALKAHGINICRRWVISYGTKNTNDLLYSGPGVDCNPMNPIPLKGSAIVGAALRSAGKSGAMVFDPCCGKGLTARCALPLGMRFAGVELVEQRAQIARNWIMKFENRKARL